ncbi:helix-turn-helix domain-containing protein [Streptomyces lavendulae]|uniref:helix-turn-helix domain-containing protein n=1 Tax=Streptomyces lavendulae TaxID=1914 RepID=UPI0036A66C34
MSLQISETDLGGAASHYTTEGLPAARRRAYWREALSNTFGSVDMKVPDEVEHGLIRTSLVGSLQAVTVEGDPHRAQRTRRLIAGSNNDEYVVVKVLSRGAVRVEQDARDACLSAGQLFVYDMSRPVQLTVPERFRTKSLALPRRALGLSESDLQRLTATPLGDRSPLGRLVTPFLSHLVDTAGTYQPQTGESVARHAVDLIQTLVEEHLGFDLQEAPNAARMTLLRIQAHIGEHLTDRELTPEVIARHHNMSVRSLHKLFELEGLTVSRWIQQRRLEQCRRALSAGQTRGRTIAAIAHHWGFASAAHFSRSFKAAYGMSPVAWRNAALHTPDGSGGSDGSVPAAALPVSPGRGQAPSTGRERMPAPA